ncbi:MAG: Increased rDNA silencing protein [Caeruleum heppii]|nr:MAG: Increased rDNA silencing protein [Caeruleum heppii]
MTVASHVSPSSNPQDRQLTSLLPLTSHASESPNGGRTAAARGAAVAFRKPPPKPRPKPNTYTGPNGARAAALKADIGTIQSGQGHLGEASGSRDKKDNRGSAGPGNAPLGAAQHSFTDSGAGQARFSNAANLARQSHLPHELLRRRSSSPSSIAANRAVARHTPRSSPSYKPSLSRDPPSHSEQYADGMVPKRQTGLNKGAMSGDSSLASRGGRKGDTSTKEPDSTSIEPTSSLISLYERHSTSSRDGPRPIFQSTNQRPVLQAPKPLRPPSIGSAPLAAALTASRKSSTSRGTVNGSPLISSRASVDHKPSAAAGTEGTNDGVPTTRVVATATASLAQNSANEGVAEGPTGPRKAPPPPPSRRTRSVQPQPGLSAEGTEDLPSLPVTTVHTYGGTNSSIHSGHLPERNLSQTLFSEPSRSSRASISASVKLTPSPQRADQVSPPPLPDRWAQLPLRPLNPHLTGDSLANAIVASSLASSRAPSPTKAQAPPLPRRHSKAHLLFHHHDEPSRTPSPAKGMRQTMRKPPKLKDEEDDRRTRNHLIRKHPNKHHEGDRKRWRDEVTERERKRYEGVWAANKGVFVPAQDQNPSVVVPEPHLAVSNLVVRDIWSRCRLGHDVLEEVWDLVDRKCVGALEKEEFVVGMWLIDQRLKGRKLPVKVTPSVWESVSRLSGVRIREKR